MLERFFRPKPDAKPEPKSMGLIDVQERMERLERKIRDLEADWAGQYDKFHRLNMRLAKRQKAIEESEDKTPEDRPRDANGPEITSNPLAQQLLARGRLL